MDDGRTGAAECLPSGRMSSPSPVPWRTAWRRVRRAVLVRRRVLAALLAALAVLAGLHAVAAPPPPTTAVLVAAQDLAGGRTLGEGDLLRVEVPDDVVPSGALADPAAVTGRVLAAPVRRGEPLTDLRLVAPGLLDGYPGLVATPVRVADADVARLLGTGDLVDLVATDPRTSESVVVATRAPVVALPRTRRAGGALTGGGLVVVAVDRTTALALTGAASTAVVSVLLTH